MQDSSGHVGDEAGLPPDRFQILALDGGGAKALFTAHILARLEQDLGVSISDSFDLIAGTSAGGIVALALGAGLAPSEIVTHFKSLVEAVFPSARRRWWHRPRHLTRPIYDADALRTALKGVLGATKLGDSAKRLVIPSWDVQAGTVHLFKTPHHPRLRRDWSARYLRIRALRRLASSSSIARLASLCTVRGPPACSVASAQEVAIGPGTLPLRLYLRAVPTSSSQPTR